MKYIHRVIINIKSKVNIITNVICINNEIFEYLYDLIYNWIIYSFKLSLMKKCNNLEIELIQELKKFDWFDFVKYFLNMINFYQSTHVDTVFPGLNDFSELSWRLWLIYYSFCLLNRRLWRLSQSYKIITCHLTAANFDS